MSMSGIEIDPEISTLFNDVKLRKNKLGDPCHTEDKESDGAQFSQLSECLTKEPRYILYDFSFTNKEGRKIQKLAFLFWCPDDAKIGDKMIYASSKDTIKKTFAGLSLEFQCNDMADLDYTTISDEVEKKS